MIMLKIRDLLSDINTYEIVTRNLVKKIESDLNDLLKRWYSNSYIDQRRMFFLRSSDKLLPKAYGLPKIHKEHIPLKIIISSVNNLLHSLASFLHKIIYENIPTSNK